MNRPKTSARQIHASQRRALVLRLRQQGSTYDAIVRAVIQHFGQAAPRSYSRRDAHNDVTHSLTILARETAEAAEVVRRLDLERLDELTLAAWPAARAGDLQAVATILRLMERRARLMGLDRPIPLTPTSPAGTPRADATGLTMESFLGIVALAQAQPDSPH